jgi:hypothetical protein
MARKDRKNELERVTIILNHNAARGIFCRDGKRGIINGWI